MITATSLVECRPSNSRGPWVETTAAPFEVRKAVHAEISRFEALRAAGGDFSDEGNCDESQGSVFAAGQLWEYRR